MLFSQLGFALKPLLHVETCVQRLNKTKNVHVKDNLIALHLIRSFFLNNNIQRQDDD